MAALDPAALAGIRDLELVSRRIVDGTIAGLHRSPFHGYSAEFSQYRHYRAGDDLKYIDWKLFARTDRLYTKQFRETTNLHAQIVFDASASMDYAAEGSVSKFAYARMIAGALAHLIISQGDSAGLITFADRIGASLRSRGGRAQLRALQLTLARVSPAGETHAAAAIRRALETGKGRGLVLLISDLYDEDDAVLRTLRQTVHAGHDLVVLHVLTRDEIEFPFRDAVELIDPETGRAVPATGDTRRAFRAATSAFLDRWRTRCASLGADYVRLFTDVPLDRGLRAYLRRRAAGVVS